DAAATDRALEVLRGRVDALGVAEPSIVRSGENRIIVELPGLQDPRKAADVLGQTAQLSVHPVLGAETGEVQTKPDDKGERVLADEDGQRLRLAPAKMTGEDVKDAEAGLYQQSAAGWFVSEDFMTDTVWPNLTGVAACTPDGDPKRRVAIVLVDTNISSPQDHPSVACKVGITGGTTEI